MSNFMKIFNIYNWSQDDKYTLALIIGLIAIMVVVVVVTLAAVGILTPKEPDNCGPGSTGPPITDVGVGELASFSPVKNKEWTKVFDSYDGCFMDLYASEGSISIPTFKQLYSYIITEGLKPLDNPFENCIEVPIIACTPNESEMTFTLNLSKYGNVNPFINGDIIVIYGVKGLTNANNSTSMQNSRIFRTKMDDDLLAYNQIIIGKSKGGAIITDGTYEGGGFVRLAGRSDIGVVNAPENMFYVYMSYMNTPFTWPFNSQTPSEANKIYSNNFKNYTNWLAKLKPTCTTIYFYEDDNKPAFTNGEVEIVSSGGGSENGNKGNGMKIYYIDLTFPMCLIAGIGKCPYYLVTDDGSGYENDPKNEDGSITLVLKQKDVVHSIKAYLGCNNTGYYNQMYGKLSLPLSTSPEQLKRFLGRALELEPTINTIGIETNNPVIVPNVYSDPNFVIMLKTTTPSSNIENNPKKENSNVETSICLKSGICSNQAIYTSDGGPTGVKPFNFVDNRESVIGICVPTKAA